MDDLTKAELDQLLAVFRDQSLQILEEMSHDLLALEASRADGDAMTRLRRGAHTIKGDSACVGLDQTTQLAHKVEDVFDGVLCGEIKFDRQSVNVIFKVLDAIKAALDSAEICDVDVESTDALIADLTAILVCNDVAAEQPGKRDSKLLSLPAQPSVPVQVEEPAKQRRGFVRVEASKIDTLLNLAGEMVIARSVMSQLRPEIESVMDVTDMIDRVNVASNQMGRLIAELQKSVLKMRMVTIDHVFRRFARPMREMATDLGKEVDLQISGGETELDRALVDIISEPLLHLLRNAVDHGLETKEERQKSGKPPAGRIAMRAYHEGNQVVVEVSDDGRGIERAALKKGAIESGYLTKDEADGLADEDALELIFLQGLSTAREVTQLSGRGIGASAVKAAIEQLRGSVAVKSEPGG